MTARRRADEGAALIVALGLVAVLLVLALAVGVVTDLMAARQRAAAAADLGALAGAPAAATSEMRACADAALAVVRNGATLRSCAVAAGDIGVTASARPRSAWGRWLARLLSGYEEPTVDARAGVR